MSGTSSEMTSSELTSSELASPELTDIDRAILDFEQDWVAHVGSKDEVVRDRFGLTPAGYHQQLNRLIDLPAAEEHAPRLVRRLRRRRSARQEQRSARRLASD